MITPSEENSEKVPSSEPRCPKGTRCRLRVANRRVMLVDCVLEEPGCCASAFPFGGGYFCSLLFKPTPATE